MSKDKATNFAFKLYEYIVFTCGVDVADKCKDIIIDQFSKFFVEAEKTSDRIARLESQLRVAKDALKAIVIEEGCAHQYLCNCMPDLAREALKKIEDLTKLT